MSIELINELNEKTKALSKSVSYMKEAGREFALKEHDYKIALAKEALTLRDSGMAVTLIDKVIYGDDTVALKRQERDIAEVMYETARENINALKVQIRVIENQIQREWGNCVNE